MYYKKSDDPSVYVFTKEGVFEYCTCFKDFRDNIDVYVPDSLHGLFLESFEVEEGDFNE